MAISVMMPARHITEIYIIFLLLIFIHQPEFAQEVGLWDCKVQSPLITLTRMAMMAITSKMWIIDPALYTKKPNSQRMINTTAMMYSRLFIALVYIVHYLKMMPFRILAFRDNHNEKWFFIYPIVGQIVYNDNCNWVVVVNSFDGMILQVIGKVYIWITLFYF